MTRHERRMKNRKASKWKQVIIERIEPCHIIKVACSVWWLYADQIRDNLWFAYIRNSYTPDNEMPIDELGMLLDRVGVPKAKIDAITKCKWHDRVENGGTREPSQQP